MRKRILVLSLIILLSRLTAFAENLPMIDLKTVHFGFTVGLNFMDFGFKPSNETIDGKTYNMDVTTVMPGFTVGVIGDLRLHEYFNLRFIPCLHLGDRTIRYSNNQNDEILKANVKSALVTLPLYIKYSAPRLNNYRFYVIAGGGVSFDAARDRTRPVLLNLPDYYIEFGTGCMFYLKYFRCSPEIKFQLGFNNRLTPIDQRSGDIITPSEYKYTNSISKLTTKMVTIVFNFE